MQAILIFMGTSTGEIQSQVLRSTTFCLPKQDYISRLAAVGLLLFKI